MYAMTSHQKHFGLHVVKKFACKAALSSLLLQGASVSASDMRGKALVGAIDMRGDRKPHLFAWPA